MKQTYNGDNENIITKSNENIPNNGEKSITNRRSTMKRSILTALIAVFVVSAVIVSLSITKADVSNGNKITLAQLDQGIQKFQEQKDNLKVTIDGGRCENVNAFREVLQQNPDFIDYRFMLTDSGQLTIALYGVKDGYRLSPVIEKLNPCPPYCERYKNEVSVR